MSGNDWIRDAAFFQEIRLAILFFKPGSHIGLLLPHVTGLWHGQSEIFIVVKTRRLAGDHRPLGVIHRAFRGGKPYANA